LFLRRDKATEAGQLSGSTTCRRWSAATSPSGDAAFRPARLRDYLARNYWSIAEASAKSDFDGVKAVNGRFKCGKF
jgi:hypothetical protein